MPGSAHMVVAGCSSCRSCGSICCLAHAARRPLGEKGFAEVDAELAEVLAVPDAELVWLLLHAFGAPPLLQARAESVLRATCCLHAQGGVRWLPRACLTRVHRMVTRPATLGSVTIALSGGVCAKPQPGAAHEAPAPADLDGGGGAGSEAERRGGGGARRRRGLSDGIWRRWCWRHRGRLSCQQPFLSLGTSRKVHPGQLFTTRARKGNPSKMQLTLASIRPPESPCYARGHWPG